MSVSKPNVAPAKRSTVLDSFSADLSRLERVLRQDAEIKQTELEKLLGWVFGSGGKRIRPALVFATARLGDADPTQVDSLAAAVETLHAATLVHDDLVDGSLVRRGMPTLNTRWSEGATVLAGDWLFARAAGFAAAAGNVRTMEVFARTLETMTAGELEQLFGRAAVPSREEYEYRIYAKTASLFEAATEAAAELALADKSGVAALATYGRELGMAFQIIDDILDFVGDERRLGKPVGSDLRAGVVTLPALVYLEKHMDEAAALAAGPEREDTVDRIVDAIRADKATLGAATREARRRADVAVAALSSVPAGAARDDLVRIAAYAVERDF